tara:strand:+ start:1020 stop:1637 length:618 start_codon:yes stop_codon:yes gene_type:complete
MAVILQSAASPGTAAWTDQDSIVVGALDTTDNAAGNTASVNINTGNATGGSSGSINIVSGTATSVRGHVNVSGLRTIATVTAPALTGATALVLADSGGVFNIDQDAAFDIDLPSPTPGAGLRFTFFLTDAGTNDVTLTVLGGAATFVGVIVNDVTSVIPATGTTLTFADGTAAVGDCIEVWSISTTLYGVRAVTSAAGGITATTP